jgi:hypothetical protein
VHSGGEEKKTLPLSGSNPGRPAGSVVIINLLSYSGYETNTYMYRI